MWICLRDAFVSIVEPEPGSTNLLCRARMAGDLSRVFPGCRVVKTPHRDYLYRTLVPRAAVAAAIAKQIAAIDYPNFKASVGEGRRHRAYASIWGVMAGLQPSPPYGSRRTRQQRAMAF